MLKKYSVFVSLLNTFSISCLLFFSYRYVTSNYDHSLGLLAFIVTCYLGFLILLSMLLMFYLVYKKYKNVLFYLYNSCILLIILFLIIMQLIVSIGAGTPDWALWLRDNIK